MKKLISSILALALVMSMGLPAFAAESNNVNTAGGNASAAVTGTYVPGTTSSGTVFSVDIAWSDMDFTYNAKKEAQWDATNHEYSGAQDAFWEGEGTITVTNHSNAKISATPVYAAEEGFEEATMVFSSKELNIASAETGSAQVGTITVTPSGSLPASADGGQIGTITVTIVQNTNVNAEDVNALYDAAMNRKAAWTDAGYGDTAQTLVQHLAELDSAASVGIGDGEGDAISQSVLNSYYAQYLAEYNELEAKVNG